MQPIINVIAGLFKPYAYEAVTIADTSGGVGLTATKYQNENGHGVKASRAVMTLETAQIRYNYDGTAPTSATGHILNANDVLVLVGGDAIQNFRRIRTGGTSGVLQVTYEQ